ncbi:MAG: hypothetical protein AB7O97_02050 [Planctomycetota bacterium]
MSRRWGRRPLRRPLSAEQREHARRIRSQRPQPRWPRPLGLALLGAAVVAAFDPEYPLPRSVPGTVSAEEVPLLLPRLAAPSGAVASGPILFLWSWEPLDAEVEVVLLDERLDEVVRIPATGGVVEVDLPWLRALPPGTQVHWRVEGTRRGQPVRTAPAAFWISG